MKLLRNTFINGQRQQNRTPKNSNRIQFETFPSTDHQYQRFEEFGHQAYQAHQDPELDKPEKTYTSNFGSLLLDDSRIEGLIRGIRNKAFKYYVRGGYSRKRRMFLTPCQVAQINKLPVDDCLFEVKNERIEREVSLANLIIIRASTYRDNSVAIQSWGNR